MLRDQAVTLKLLEFLPCEADVHPYGSRLCKNDEADQYAVMITYDGKGKKGRTNCGVVRYDKHVSVSRQLVQHRGEICQLQLHHAELLSHARACMLERLDDLRGPLVPRWSKLVRVSTVLVIAVRLVPRRCCARGK